MADFSATLFRIALISLGVIPAFSASATRCAANRAWPTICRATVSSQSAARNPEGPAQSTNEKTSVAAIVLIVSMANCSFCNLFLSAVGCRTGYPYCWGLYVLYRQACGAAARLNQEIFARSQGRNVRSRGAKFYPADLRNRYLCSPVSTSSPRWL